MSSRRSPSIRARSFHVEVAGIERNFKTYNPATGQHSTKSGGGVSLNANVEVVKNFRVVTNNYWSDGGGRYLFGQAPDVIVRADGSISPIHAGGTVDGVECDHQEHAALRLLRRHLHRPQHGCSMPTARRLVGYGYTGSPNSQNRAINEVTFGFNQTMWKNPRYGAINFMGQYEWLQRNPWFVATGAPESGARQHYLLQPPLHAARVHAELLNKL